MKQQRSSGEFYGAIISSFGLGILFALIVAYLTHHSPIPISLSAFGSFCCGIGTLIMQVARKKRVSETHVDEKRDA
jgi:hypothetical protein